jgi:hypothetical protein
MLAICVATCGHACEHHAATCGHAFEQHAAHLRDEECAQKVPEKECSFDLLVWSSWPWLRALGCALVASRSSLRGLHFLSLASGPRVDLSTLRPTQRLPHRLASRFNFLVVVLASCAATCGQYARQHAGMHAATCGHACEQHVWQLHLHFE